MCAMQFKNIENLHDKVHAISFTKGEIDILLCKASLSTSIFSFFVIMTIKIVQNFTTIELICGHIRDRYYNTTVSLDLID